MLPIGTELKVGPQFWRHQLPECKIVKLVYRLSSWAFTDIEGECSIVDTEVADISVMETGEITLEKRGIVPSPWTYKVQHSVSAENAAALIEDIRRCVGEVDC